MNNLAEIKAAGTAAYSTLIEKAWESPIFKDELINNPIKTFESTIGVKFPATHKLIVEDQSDSSIIYLNIPVRPNFDELELTDEQLEAVAGGGTPAAIGAATLIAGGCVLAVGACIFIGAAVCAYHIARK
ncbi:MAG: NHLP leader peptide family RiPP precursor [Spirosomaceae bacterium]|jgi:hypothetical protein|nr:NHLP leader peptide family RiPP precursor [Spirosomataceae bacterium]